MMRNLQLQFVGVLLLISQCYQCQCDAASTNLFAGISRSAIVDFNNEEEMMIKTSSNNLLNKDDNENNQLVDRAALTTHDSTNIKLNDMRGGGTSSSTISYIIPTIATITTQSINIAIAAMVASGYIGCWLASILIQQLQPYSSSLVVDRNSIPSSSTILQSVIKYQWTLLASITHLLLTTNTHHTQSTKFKNQPLYLPTLWIYSHMVNPTLGGLIGCTQLFLGGVSELLGSHWVTNKVGNLMEFRLPPLLDDDDDEGNSNDDGINHIPSSNVVVAAETLNRGELFGNGLARVLSSCAIFTSFPRDCLALYMGGCAFLTWWKSSTLSSGSNNIGVWKAIREQWMPWWMDGLMSETFDTKAVTRRLFALHCIIMLVKGTTALLLQL